MRKAAASVPVKRPRRLGSRPAGRAGLNCSLTPSASPYNVHRGLWGLERTATVHNLGAELAVVEQLVGLPVADVERDLILATLRDTGGNRTHAASMLGIAIRTLRNKVKAYAAQGYEVPDSGQAAH